MSDDFAVFLGLLACIVPLGLLVAVVVYVVRSSGLRRRIEALENDVAQITGEQKETTRYLQGLHAQLQAGELRVASPRPATATATTPETQPEEPPLARTIDAAPASTTDAMRARLSAESSELTATQSEEAVDEGAPEAGATIEPGPSAPPTTDASAPPTTDASAPPPTTSGDEVPVARPATPTGTTQPAASADVFGPAPTGTAPPAASADVFGPAPTAAAAGAQPPVRPAKPSMGLEQWIGVRGAAALGAFLLVLSAFYFFAYSIEHGFIGPAMRVVIGAGLGVSCLLAGELRLRKTHVVLANFLDGAGIAILYVTIWAGRSLYELYPNWAATVGMIAITATCVTLASARRSSVIASLGLFGGFVTPLALSTGVDRPIPLFGYLLLLDIAMLALARARRWPWLAFLSLGGTFLYQIGWLSFRLDEERLVLGVAISLVFAVVFVAWPRSSSDKQAQEQEGLSWRLLRAASVVLPMLFAFVLAVRSDLGAHFWPTAVQLGVLALAGSVLSARQQSPITGITVAMSAAGVMLGWAIAHPLSDPTLMTRWLGLVAALGLLMHVVAEFDRGEPGAARMVASAAHVLFASLVALMTIAYAGGSPWPQLAYFALATLLAARAAGFPNSRLVPIAVGALLAFSLGAAFVMHVGDAWSTSPTLLAALWVTLAALTQIGGVWPRPATLRHASDQAAILVACCFLVALPAARGVLGVVPIYASTLTLVVLGLLAATRLRDGAWIAPILGAALIGHGIDLNTHTANGTATLQLGAMAATVLLFSAWPLCLGRRRDANHFRVAVLAAPLYFLPMRTLWLRAFGDSAQGLLPVALALLSLGLAVAARRSTRGDSTPEGEAKGRSGLIWSLVAATSFLTVAIPLQLDNEWITIGWSLEAVVLLVLFRRFEHAGLKYFAIALASAVFIRLVFNPYLLDYHLRGSYRVVNWLSYTYLVPAFCMLGMWRLLSQSEIALRRPWERAIFSERRAELALLSASAFIVVLFAWVNLTIFDIFAPGRELTIPLDRMPARDLSLSLAWAVFALGMLAVGLVRKSMPLRVASLLLILLTCAKTFLYDLGHLADLYRVASLAGLAVSMIVISLVYQRFVFRQEKDEEEPS